MNKIILFSLSAALSCHTPPQKQVITSEIPNGHAIYDSAGFSGSCMIWCPESDSLYYFNAADTGKGYIPASTFKILNTLISLETGVMKSENDTLHWDGNKRWLDSWNQNMDLQKAYRLSCVWFYQELARRNGRNSMNRYIRMCRYGNGDTSGAVDSFWLNGGIRINHRQQIQLLQEIKNETLPFSKHSYFTAKKIMIQDSGTNFILRAKSGWADSGGISIGWYVGWLEKNGKTWYFSNRIYGGSDETPQKFGKARIDIALSILKEVAGQF